MAPGNKSPRNRQLNIALTEAEHAALSARASALELRPVEYARLLVLGGGHTVIDARPPQIDILAFEQLKRLGNNLNQISRRFNATGHPPPDSLPRLLADIRSVLARGQQD